MPNDNQSHQRLVSKRAFMKAGTMSIPASISLAGCTGGNGGDTDGSQEDSSGPPEAWNPQQDIVSFIVGLTPGSTRDVIARAWASAAEPHYPDGTSTAVENVPGAEGRIAMQQLHGGPPSGDMVSISYLDEPFLLAKDAPDVETTDFQWIGALFSSIRGISVNPKTRDVDAHFQWTWQDFIDSAKEEKFNIGVVVPIQELAMRIPFNTTDELTEGEHFEFISMPGGSEARTAIDRGDLDIYPESFSGAFFTDRDQFYKVQVAYADPETNPDLVERLSKAESNDGQIDGVPESAYVVNQSTISQDVANLAVAATYNEYILGAPPETPDKVINVHREAGKQAKGSEKILEAVDKVLNRNMYNPVFKDGHVQSLLDKRQEYTEGNELYEEVVQQMS